MEDRKVVLKAAATNPSWDRQHRRNRSCLCAKAMCFRRRKSCQHCNYKEASLAQNCTVEPVISSLPCPQGLPHCSPTDAAVLISFSARWDSSEINTCSCQHTPSHPSHTHQGRLIQGSQKRGLACEKGVAPKIYLSESKTKPS